MRLRKEEMGGFELMPELQDKAAVLKLPGRSFKENQGAYFQTRIQSRSPCFPNE